MLSFITSMDFLKRSIKFFSFSLNCLVALVWCVLQDVISIAIDDCSFETRLFHLFWLLKPAVCVTSKHEIVSIGCSSTQSCC